MIGLEYITPTNWADYELVDSGGGQKLERFGDFVLARPEPQAVWVPSLPASEWTAMAHATFRRGDVRGGDRAEGRGRSDSTRSTDTDRGEWSRKPSMPDQWWVRYDSGELRLRMRLGMTSFKHVGIFPEQAANWEFIFDRCKEMSTSSASGSEHAGGRRCASAAGALEYRPPHGAAADSTLNAPRVLNLFAYTGGATLAALAAGAAVTHVDSVKQVVAWARENAAASGLDGARWIVDDALKFVLREVRRGSKYNGIVLDPPAYGRGPDGEKWILERDVAPLLEACAQLLTPGGFVVFNLYSMGLSALVARTAAHRAFGTPQFEQFGELFFHDRHGKALPLGVYYRGVLRE